ncbi:hypothetical protein SVIOM342S_06328 [Streptomyces violaceorubidus]
MHTTTAPTAAAPTHSYARDTGDYLLQPPDPARRVPCRVDPVGAASTCSPC